MRTSRILLASLLLGGTLAVSSCGKYPDGPNFSLMSKKARLVGDWNLVERTSDNVTITNTDDDDIVTFEKDGSGRLSDNGISIEIEWKFVRDKEYINVSYTTNGFSVSEDVRILRLTNKELWVERDDDDIEKYDAQ